MFEGEAIAFVLARGEGLLKPIFMRSNIAHTDVGRGEKHLAQFNEGRNGLGDSSQTDGQGAVVKFNGWHHVDVFSC